MKYRKDYEYHKKIANFKAYNLGNSEKIIRGFICPFIVGQTLKETPVFEKTWENKKLILNENDFTCFVTQSFPTGKSNISFSKEVVRDHYIFTSSIEDNSPYSFFIQVLLLLKILNYFISKNKAKIFKK